SESGVVLSQRCKSPRFACSVRRNGSVPTCGLRSKEMCRTLLGGDAARLGKALDPVLDVAQRFKGGRDRGRWNIPQHIVCDGVAQAVEIVDELATARGEEQPVGATIARIMPPFEQPVLDQTIEQS